MWLSLQGVPLRVTAPHLARWGQARRGALADMWSLKELYSSVVMSLTRSCSSVTMVLSREGMAVWQRGVSITVSALLPSEAECWSGGE